MSYVVVPASLDDAKTRLVELESIATATGWERAAIVAAYVRLGEVGVANVNSDICTPVGFAALGIVGLASPATVRRYVRAWLDANGDNYPARGKRAKLPAAPWPPEAANLGSRVAAGVDDAVDQLIDKHGVEAVATTLATKAPAETIAAIVARPEYDTVPVAELASPVESWAPTREARLREAVANLTVALAVIADLVAEGDLSSDELALRDRAVEATIDFSASLAGAAL